MRRQPFLTAASVLLCSTAAAQQADPSRIQPITVPIRDAGTLDLTTRSWLGSAPEYVGKIFDNTCQWTGGGFYAIAEHCTDLYDEGRIPSPSDPAAPPGAEEWYAVGGFQIGYCTGWPTGKIDIRIAFWDHKGGPCAGGAPQSPIVPPYYAGAEAYFDLSGHGLPGDNSGGGTLACWTVTITFGNGFCLLGDGDGSWNGDDTDLFTWSFQHENDNATYGVAAGPILAGEPTAGAFGACTYAFPCGTDATGNACGTGLDTSDQVWMNTDGCAVGSSACSGVPAGSCRGAAATGCYTFGGWPANPLASLWLEVTSAGYCTCGWPPFVYCTYNQASTSTSCGFYQCPSFNGCMARITTSKPLKHPTWNADDYDIVVNTADSDRPAVIFGGLHGMAAIPFSSGTLCVQPPIQRTPVQNTGGSGGCTGSMTLRINDPATSGPILNPLPGSLVYYQGWLRDPMSASGSDVSDAIEVHFRL